MQKTLIVVALFLVAVYVVVLCTGLTSRRDTTNYIIADPGPDPRIVKQINVSGKIICKKKLHGKDVVVTATGIWSAPAQELSNHSTKSIVKSVWNTDPNGIYFIDYSFPHLAMAIEIGQAPTSTLTAQYYLIRVQPPAGWHAVPAEQKISKDTKKLNFRLEPGS
jgi:hypothetical protein